MGAGTRAMESKRSHLEMIQGVINRMAANSFFLKGWSISLVAALFALAQKESNSAYMFLAYFPVIVFWTLDGYYLWQEKLFRSLYDKVRLMKDEEIDFSMNTRAFEDRVGSFLETVFSKTVWPFHGIIGLSILVVFVLSSFKK
jgi:hypothetical protein